MDQIVPLLNVEDVSNSIEFYQNNLSFSVDHKWESDGQLAWATISNGSAKLMLNRKTGTEHAHRRARPHYQDVVLYIGVPDVNALHAALQTAGLGPTPLEDQMYGVRECGLRDPDGYHLALTSPLGSDD